MVAGLQKPTFAKATSSTRTTTSAKLATSGRSTAYSKANQKQSLSAVSYGIRAQRTVSGSGLIFNPSKLRDYRATISDQRHYYNDNRAGLYAPMPQIAPAQSAGNNSGMSSLDKFALGMQAVNTLTGSLGQILDLSKSGKSSKSGNSSNSNSSVAKMNGPKDNNNAGKAAIDGMENAKDSTALRDAIATARGEFDRLDGRETELKNLLNDNKTAEYNDAKKNVSTKQSEVKDKEKTLSKCRGNVNSSKQSVDVAKNLQDSAEASFNNAEKQVGAADSGVTSATRDYANAKSTLATTPKKIKENGEWKDNPKYKDAEEAVRQKKEALEAAKQKLQKSKELSEDAKVAYNKAQGDYEKQNDIYAKTQEALTNAETAEEKAKDDLEKANQDLSNMKEIIETYEKNKSELEQVTEQKGKLKEQIDKQEARLKQLQEQDAKDYEKVNNQKDDLNGKIDKSRSNINADGKVDKSDKKELDKYDRYQAQWREADAKSQELEKRIIQTALAGSSGGNIGQCTLNGKQYFVVDGKLATSQEYNEALRKGILGNPQ